MPPSNRAAGKNPANSARVGGYTRADGTRVKSHTREVQWARSKAVWVGLGFSSLSAVGIILEAGVTLMSTIAILVIAGATTVAVIAGAYAEANKKKLGTQRKRRTTTRTRTGTRKTTRRR